MMRFTRRLKVTDGLMQIYRWKESTETGVREQDARMVEESRQTLDSESGLGFLN
jgi:hypothetical protein